MGTDRGHSPRLLLDTNIVIAHENDGSAPHVHAGAADTLVKLARGLGFQLLLSSGTRSDFTDAPAELKQRRLRTLGKYYRTLDRVPENSTVRAEFPAMLSHNDAADLEVLSTFATGLPTVLVTEDVTMKRRAVRAGLSNVFDIDAAINWLRELQDPTLYNAAVAEMIPAYQVGVQASLFDSLKDDYDFAAWPRRSCAKNGPSSSSGGRRIRTVSPSSRQRLARSDWATRCSRFARSRSATPAAPALAGVGSFCSAQWWILHERPTTA